MRKVVLFFLGLVFLSLGFTVGFILVWDYDDVDMTDVEETFQKNASYEYHYQKLNKAGQESYRRLYYAIETRREDIRLYDTSVKQSEELYQCVLSDHPEFFYVSTGYEYIKENDDLIFYPQYECSLKEQKKLQKQVDSSIEKIMKKVDQKKTSLEKIKLLYEYIIETVQYKSQKRDQNLLSALLDKKSVCTGYAKAYQYLLKKAGIEATAINGQSLEKKEGHVWVMIHMKDNYYYSDPTWGDVEQKGMTHTCYGYMLMNSQEMMKNYEVDRYYELTQKGAIRYYNEINCYMRTYRTSVLSKAIQYAKKNKQKVAEFQCANEEVYKQTKSRMKYSYDIYDALVKNGYPSGEGRYSFIDELRIIEIYF